MPQAEIGKLTRRYIFNVLFWPVEEDGSLLPAYHESRGDEQSPLDHWCYVMMLRVGCPRWRAEQLWEQRQEEIRAAVARGGRNRGQ